MKRFVVALIFAMSTNIAAAGITTRDLSSAGFDGLAETEKAQILENVTARSNALSPSKSIGMSNPENIQKWVDVGTNIGKSLGGAAKEIGVAVNDFVKTPVGMLTTFLIVWHVMGGALVHLFGGVLIWILGFTILTYLMRRSTSLIKKYDKETEKLIMVERKELSTDATIGWTLMYAVVLLGGLISIFTF